MVELVHMELVAVRLLGVRLHECLTSEMSGYC